MNSELSYWSHAIDLCGDTLLVLKPEELEARAPKIVAILRNAAHRLRKTEIVLDFVREYADEPCSYGDNCPPFGTRHYTCEHCKAREALKRSGLR